jgi:hypothetical protein
LSWASETGNIEVTKFGLKFKEEVLYRSLGNAVNVELGDAQVYVKEGAEEETFKFHMFPRISGNILSLVK